MNKFLLKISLASLFFSGYAFAEGSMKSDVNQATEPKVEQTESQHGCRPQPEPKSCSPSKKCVPECREKKKKCNKCNPKPTCSPKKGCTPSN
ncbi:MAG: hypothetical protein ACOVOR_03670 [Rhabdochlamydiaceae bacterium]